jgi:hypothetical protein
LPVLRAWMRRVAAWRSSVARVSVIDVLVCLMEG